MVQPGEHLGFVVETPAMPRLRAASFGQRLQAELIEPVGAPLGPDLLDGRDE